MYLWLAPQVGLRFRFYRSRLGQARYVGFVVRRSFHAVVLLVAVVMQLTRQAAVLGASRGWRAQERLWWEDGRKEEARQFD